GVRSRASRPWSSVRGRASRGRRRRRSPRPRLRTCASPTSCLWRCVAWRALYAGDADAPRGAPAPRAPPATRSRSDLLGDTKDCAAGARGACDLRRVRTKRTPGNDTQARAMPADAGGEVGRTNAVARFPEQVLLDDPVLERLERDDREAATRPQQRHGRDETLLKVRELVIDRDAQRLEDTRCRIHR